MRILITGGAGFIGSHFVDYFLNKKNDDVVCLDSFRHKGCFTRLHDVLPQLDSDFFEYQLHDLSVPLDDVLVKRLHPEHIDVIINLASNSAVERSITNPGECWRNNTNIILNMLEFARLCPHLTHFVQISTDEVYGDAMSQTTGHREWDSIVPSNPYSASKAAQEALCIAYWRTYKLPVVLINTMNNIGERQDPEKFLPLIIRSIIQDKEIPIYCNQQMMPGSRVYLDAQDHADAIDFIISRAPNKYGEEPLPSRFNVCGDTERDNLQLAHCVSDCIGKELKYKLVRAESLRPGYDRRYFLDGSQLAKFGWRPKIPFTNTIQRIVDHVMQKQEWI
jgi:dTDP-glucose 4,6-dehydratase